MAIAVIEPLLAEATAVEGGAATESSGNSGLLQGLSGGTGGNKNSSPAPKGFSEAQENSAMTRTAQFQLGAKG